MISSNPEIDSDGTKRWFNSEGKLDRLDGPAYEWVDGTKSWWKDGLKHRLDGPAFEYADGTKYWYKDGKRHRLDGPAVEWSDKLETADEARQLASKEWWVNGKQTTEAGLESAVKLYYCWLVLES